MNSSASNHFLLIGNGSYLNRGCEAIVRGTVEILDNVFGTETRYTCSSFGDSAWIREQSEAEPCSRIQHEWLKPRGRCSFEYAKHLVNRFCGTKFEPRMYFVPDGTPRAALQVGGDNYTLDYGYPHNFMAIDRKLLARDIPLILWGASVGPFSADLAFEAEMVQHLRRFTLITVRETRSFEYLRRLGLENVLRVADPAFTMAAEPVPGLELPDEFVGLNLSPLAGRKVCTGDPGAWLSACTSALGNLASATDLPVVLIPHVFTPTAVNDDLAFLEQLARSFPAGPRIRVIRRKLTAPQLKWVIGKARAFAGARTHATIAALSQAVPTLCLAYSVKAWGVSEEVYGQPGYCVAAESLTRPRTLAERMSELLKHGPAIRAELQARLPAIQTRALEAGVHLRQVLAQWN